MDKIHFFASGGAPPPVRAPVATVADRYKIPHVGVTAMEAWLAMRETVTPHWEYSWMYGLVIFTPAPKGSIWEGKPGYTLADIHPRILRQIADQTNKKAAVYAMDDPDGRVTYPGDAAMLKAAGFDPIYEGNIGLFPPDTTDYSPMIKAWKDYDVEILWGNAPAPHFGTLLRQSHALNFKPKLVFAGKAALFYTDVNAWGGDLPLGVQIEMWWHPSYDPEEAPGIGGTTPMSLFERWVEETGEPLNPNIGWSYPTIQILVDAIERAGTLDSDAVVKAISETDMLTLNHRVKFDQETQFCWSPLYSGQWQKTDNPWVWEMPIVFSEHDFIKPTAELLFPIPYD